MGIMFSEAARIAKQVKQHNISGRCLSFGRQIMFFNIQRLLPMLMATGHMEMDEKGFVPLHPATAKDVHEQIFKKSYFNKLKPYAHYKDLDWAKADWIDDSFFIKALGFETYHTLDATSYEDCDIVYDLNQNDIRSAIDAPYDLVLDTGTIEHVFMTQNFMKNIFDALKVGGYVIHCTPTNNHIDHGFYQMSPTLFHDFYAANNYDVQEITLCGRSYHYVDANTFDREIPYISGCLDDVSFGRFDDRIYVTFVVARKKADSTWNVIPQQGVYKGNIWEAGQKSKTA